MKARQIVVTRRAEEQLDRCLAYIIHKLRNPQAAENVYQDFYATAQALSVMADSVAEPKEALLRNRHLKRKNFDKHDYFLLFQSNEDTVVITNVYHFRENYLAKLK